jgi:hypothetical protein
VAVDREIRLIQSMARVLTKEKLLRKTLKRKKRRSNEEDPYFKAKEDCWGCKADR